MTIQPMLALFGLGGPEIVIILFVLIILAIGFSICVAAGFFIFSKMNANREKGVTAPAPPAVPPGTQGQ